jgi:hypothetical protein
VAAAAHTVRAAAVGNRGDQLVVGTVGTHGVERSKNKTPEGRANRGSMYRKAHSLPNAIERQYQAAKLALITLVNKFIMVRIIR